MTAPQVRYMHGELPPHTPSSPLKHRMSLYPTLPQNTLPSRIPPACRRIAVILVLMLLTISFMVHEQLHLYAYDDAYIHFRIAVNLLLHGQPYFNLGEPVFGSSSPLWLGVVTGLFGLFGAAPTVIARANALIVVCSTLVWIDVLIRLNPATPHIRRWIVGLALFGSQLLAGAGMMETPLALLLMGLSFRSALTSSSLVGIWLGLAILTRLEILLSAPFLLYALPTRPMRTQAFFQLITLGSVSAGICVFFFGTLIPHSVIAKKIVYAALPNDIIQLFLRTWIGEDVVAGHRPLLAFWLIVMVSLTLTLILRKNREPAAHASEGNLLRLWLALGAFTGLLSIGYLFSGAPLFPWYSQLIIIPLCLLTICLPIRPAATLLSLLICLPSLCMGIRLIAASCNPVYHPEFTSGARVRRYLELGVELNRILAPASVVATEIGAFGFRYQGKVIDAVGLVSPEALPFHERASSSPSRHTLLGTLPVGLVGALKPAAIVSLSAFLGSFPTSSLVDEYARLDLAPFLPADRQLWDSAQGSSRDFWARQILYVYLKKKVPGDTSDTPGP